MPTKAAVKPARVCKHTAQSAVKNVPTHIRNTPFCVVFLIRYASDPADAADGCAASGDRERNYLVIHMSPQFAIPYEAHTSAPAGEPLIHWSIATPQ